MKLANVPTCPFSTYRVSLAPCFRVGKSKETAKAPLEKETEEEEEEEKTKDITLGRSFLLIFPT